MAGGNLQVTIAIESEVVVTFDRDLNRSRVRIGSDHKVGLDLALGIAVVSEIDPRPDIVLGNRSVEGNTGVPLGGIGADKIVHVAGQLIARVYFLRGVGVQQLDPNGARLFEHRAGPVAFAPPTPHAVENDDGFVILDEKPIAAGSSEKL